jgi:hypothetical protein
VLIILSRDLAGEAYQSSKTSEVLRGNNTRWRAPPKRITITSGAGEQHLADAPSKGVETAIDSIATAMNTAA